MVQPHSHHTATLYENVVEQLRKKNVRMTETRKAIIFYIIQSQDHPNAEKIYTDLKTRYPTISLATVYNNLNFLVNEGFVSEIKVSKEKTTYYDFMGHQHVNIVCENCGKLSDFMNVELLEMQQEAHKQTGYMITKSQILMYGICPICQKNSHFSK